MAQMKAYTIPMKNWALILKWGHFCNKFPKSWMCCTQLLHFFVISHYSFNPGMDVSTMWLKSTYGYLQRYGTLFHLKQKRKRFADFVQSANLNLQATPLHSPLKEGMKYR